MPDSVVARVADRLNIQPEQTDRVLRTLAQLIKKQSARDGRVRIPGLGVFRQAGDALSFEPDAGLAEAVNHRFVGLDAVPMAPEQAALEPGMTEPEGMEPEPAEPVTTEHPAEAPDIPVTPLLPDDIAADAEEEHVEPVAEEPAEAAAPAEEVEEAEPAEETPTAHEEVVAEEPVAEEPRADLHAAEEEPAPVEVPADEDHLDEAPAAIEAPVAEDDTAEETPFAEEEQVDEEPVFDDETVEEMPPLEDAPADEEEEALAPMPEDALTDEDGAEEEPLEAEQPVDDGLIEEEETEDAPFEPSLVDVDYDDPDVSEAAAYAQLQDEPDAVDEPEWAEEEPEAVEESEAIKEPKAIEEPEADGVEKPSEWAPTPVGWSQDDLDDLLQGVDEEETLDEAPLPPELGIPKDETEGEEAAFDIPRDEPDLEEGTFDEPADEEELKEEEADEPIAVPPVAIPVDLPPQPPPPRKVHTPEKPRRRSVLPWILLVTAVIIIGATLYFMYGPSLPTTEVDTPPTAAQEPPPQEAAQPGTPAAEAPTAAPEDTTTETPLPAEEPPPQEPTAEPPAPTPNRIDVPRGGYTLVVGSSTQQSTAQNQAERFRQQFSDQGLPVDVLADRSGDVTRYRVVVGQASTLDDIVALKARHAANLPGDAWPINIALITSEGS